MAITQSGMNATVLGQEIADIITDSNASEEAKQQIRALWIKISETIVKHIQENAVVEIPAANANTTAMTNAVAVPQDGGASLKATYLTSPSLLNPDIGKGTIK